MTKKLFFIMCLSLYILNSFAKPVKKLVIWGRDNSKVAYLLTDTPQILFSNNDLIINSGGTEVNYDIKNMYKFTYEDFESTEISQIGADNIFNFEDNILTFPHLSNGVNISIYEINGNIVYNKFIKEPCSLTYSLKHLSSGTYILNIGNLTYKIIKK